MRPDELEELIDRELNQLPLPQAPRTLLPRVMTAVGELRARPWYARPWVTWPSAWQVLSAAAVVLFVTALWAALPAIRVVAAAAPSTLVGRVAVQLTIFADYVEGLTGALQVLWRALVQPVGVYAFAVVATMGVACAALVAALNRIVLGRGFQQ